jgi:hypothetical protein
LTQAKCIFPVGEPAPLDAGATVAARVTGEPWLAFGSDEVRLTWVAAGGTTIFQASEAPLRKLKSPVYAAVIECGPAF